MREGLRSCGMFRLGWDADEMEAKYDRQLGDPSVCKTKNSEVFVMSDRSEHNLGKLEDLKLLLKQDNILFTVIYTSDSDKAQDIRKLETISQHHGIYPQTFIRTPAGHYHFIGPWETIEVLYKWKDIPRYIEESLALNPGGPRWEDVFEGVKRDPAGNGGQVQALKEEEGVAPDDFLLGH